MLKSGPLNISGSSPGSLQAGAFSGEGRRGELLDNGAAYLGGSLSSGILYLKCQGRSVPLGTVLSKMVEAGPSWGIVDQGAGLKAT